MKPIVRSARMGKAAAFIAAAESGDADQYLYEQAAILIEKEMREKPGLTQRDVAAQVGKSRQYVNRLLQALSRSRDKKEPFKVDWQSGKRKPVVEELQQAIEQASPAERKKLVEAVTDPSTVAGRHIENALAEREQAAKKKKSEKVEEPLTGIPLPTLWASMAVTMDTWAREMSVLRDEDLDDLARGNPDGAAQVAGVVERLDEQTQRYLLRLRPRPDLKVIESDDIIEGVVRIA